MSTSGDAWFVRPDVFVVVIVCLLMIDFGPFFLLVHNGAFIPLFGAMIVVVHRASWTTRALARVPFIHLGRASYCIYLLQYPVLATFSYLARAQSGLSSELLLLYVAGLMISSLIAHRFFEEPARVLVLKSLSVIAARRAAHKR